MRNKYVPTVFRPTVKTQSSGDDNDSGKAVNRILSNELRGIKLTIKTDRWKLDKKNIVRPGQIISIYAPDLYIFKETEFFIESINFSGNHERVISTLNCVLPEVYTEEIPKITIFEGINMRPKLHV